MRAAIFGSQEVYNNYGDFTAYNIGYNFYTEHEIDILEMINKLNNDAKRSIEKRLQEEVGEIKSTTIFRHRFQGKLRKAVNKDSIQMKKWRNTPFKDYILSPSVPILVRKIIIDNSEIKSKHNKFITNNGEYTLLLVNSENNIEIFKDIIGKKRKFNEETFFNMADYDRDTMNRNTGYFLNGRPTMPHLTENAIAGQWARDGFMILVSKRLEDEKHIVQSIVDAIHRGDLAIVYSERRVFKDKGCGLIILDRAYMPSM